ncbi:hypothetical protein EDD86DRAFT_186313 [Gorgonomyces haynaldii]|nr:hypothetical protein EDD86DRAFT_186313 [Gorgonomyces haynaldii]
MSTKEQLKQRMLAAPVIKKQTLKPIEDRTDKQSSIQQLEMYSNAGKSTNRLLFEIISCLKAQTQPIGYQEIIRLTTIDLENNAELLERVRNNERIIFNPQNETFEYQATYQVRSKQDLLELLRKNQGIQALDVKELKESYSGVMQFIEELVNENHILMMKNKDGSPRVIYLNDKSLGIYMSSEFKDSWHQMHIAPDIDFARELQKAGLKAAVLEQEQVVKGQKKQKSKRRSRIKVTNTHLDVDLTKDVVVNP